MCIDGSLAHFVPLHRGVDAADPDAVRKPGSTEAPPATVISADLELSDIHALKRACDHP
jgi:hypothetical protein